MSDDDWNPHHRERPIGKKPTKQKKRKAGRPASGEKPKKKGNFGKKPCSTRRRYSNETKRLAIEQLAELRKTEQNPFAEFTHRNPATPEKTARGWESKREQICTNSQHPKYVCDACVSADAMSNSLRKAKFPSQESELFDKICLKRANGVPISNKWVQVTMLNLLSEQKPDGYETFKASQPWRARFFHRFNLTSSDDT